LTARRVAQHLLLAHCNPALQHCSAMPNITSDEFCSELQENKLGAYGKKINITKQMQV